MSSLFQADGLRTKSSVCMKLICKEVRKGNRNLSQSQVRFNLSKNSQRSSEEGDHTEPFKRPVKFKPMPFVKRKRVMNSDEQYAMDMRFIMKNIDCFAPKKDIMQSMQEGKKIPVPERDKWIRETPSSFILP